MGADLLTVSGRPYLRLRKVGKGMLVPDRPSPDGAGNSNLHVATYHQAWRREIERCGPAPGGEGTAFPPAGDEPIARWFFGAAADVRHRAE